MNLFHMTIPPMTRMVGQASVWLDKAQAHAELKKFDPQVLLTARLAPDQWPLVRQLQAIAIAPLRAAAGLRGVEAPTMTDLEPTIDAARSRLAATLAALRGLTEEEFRGAEQRVVPLPFLPGKGMQAPDFVVQFALPNFYFHATTAYSILRHNGVELGKPDYIGHIDLRDL
jgi:hypothetical protein